MAVMTRSARGSKRRLSQAAIKKALRTVRVVNEGGSWRVKRVAAPQVWRFESKDEALAKARELATQAKGLRIVVHGRSGAIKATLSASGGRLVADK